MASPITVLRGMIYVTTGTVDGNTITQDDGKAVEIFSPKIEFDLQNKIFKNPRPVASGDTGIIVPYDLIIDLKNIIRVILVTGILEDESGESAIEKRDNLINMMESQRGLKLLWGLSGNYRTIFGETDTDKIFVEKVKFTETAGKAGDADKAGDPGPLHKIEVQINFLVGKDVA